MGMSEETAARAVESSFQSIDRKSLDELRRLIHPPEGVPDAIFAVLALLGVPRQQWTWATAQHRMKDVNRFLDTDLAGVRRQIGNGMLPRRNITLLRPLLELGHIKNIGAMERKSRAAASLLQVVLTLVEYHDAVATKSPSREINEIAEPVACDNTMPVTRQGHRQYLSQYFREAIQVGGPIVAEALAKELASGIGVAARQHALEAETRLASHQSSDATKDQDFDNSRAVLDGRRQLDGAASPQFPGPTESPESTVILQRGGEGGGRAGRAGAQTNVDDAQELKSRVVGLELELEAAGKQVAESAKKAQQNSDLLTAEIDGKKKVK